VEGAVRAAVDAGFKCLVVEDACATRDLDRDGQVLKADWVHQTTLATLEGAYADVIKTEALLAK
jgi:nicotinamidase-related amidase